MSLTTAVQHYKYLNHVDKQAIRVDIIKNGKLDLEAICEVERFGATDSCITVDLKCFCGIQCIKDTFIDL